jgi:UDP-N-acetylmuramoyl-tripeptide--D-alanyl-D-alanine ligase
VHDATRGAKLGVPVYVVDDTTRALGRLARYRRRVWGRPVIGVVGTNGKTSTKELLRAALGSMLRVHATVGNYNNLVGVPQTLFALPDDGDVAVIEMGTNQPGEVAACARSSSPTSSSSRRSPRSISKGLGDLEGGAARGDERVRSRPDGRVPCVAAGGRRRGEVARGPHHRRGD